MCEKIIFPKVTIETSVVCMRLRFQQSVLSYLSFRWLQVVTGHDVNQEVKLVELCYSHGNVIPL